LKADKTKDLKFSTFVETLQYRSEHQKDKIVYRFLVDGEEKEEKLTYGELDQKAKAIAAMLQEKFAPGDRALLLYPPGLEFISGFFGCLYAGIIAVPVYPPNPSDMEKSMNKLKGIISDSKPKIALTNKDIILKLKLLSVRYWALRKMKWIASDNIKENLSEKWQLPDITKDNLAFLQYTSGSTGNPKGVMVSHGNLMHNNEIIKQAFEHTEESSGVSWLPVYHDMGLIGKVLQPAYAGGSCTLMSPIAFLKKPLRWLKAVSKYKPDTSGGPNFAYELCTQKITPEQIKELDLSSWNLAFNGAEPIHIETFKKFAEYFKPCGFKKNSFYPCYGLAEATLAVSGGIKKDEPTVLYVDKLALSQNKAVFCDPEDKNAIQKAQSIVSCGKAWLDQKILIVEPETLKECRQCNIGEIWVKGESIAKGYWNNKEQTEKTFNAYIADTGEGPFLRTEDLGFIKNNELFVTGRLKDLIIIRGRNHYPQDIELTVENSHNGFRPGCAAAFAIEIENEERLVVVQELKIDFVKKIDKDEAIKAIKINVAENHELQVYAALLIKPKTIPKTSSGKIQRKACKEIFLNNKFKILAESKLNLKKRVSNISKDVPKKKTKNQLEIKRSIEDWLIYRISEELLVEPDDIDLDAPLTDFGLDSARVVSIAGDLEEWLGVEVPPTLLFDYPTIEALAKHLSEISN
jgi:acyl-CoA synthetase (AMP-forming)/AMP-acid ligase II/acyl carrier protein